MLHPNLDWATIQPLSASHNYQVEITNGNNVQFIFDNINLPDEDSNEPESHGYIAYKIKPLSSLVLGDFVSGDASIFFDFNAPIITNIVTTTIVEEIDEFPNAICQDMQVQLDDFGNVILDATIIGANSTDDNGVASYEVSPDSFDCSELGFQTVTLTITDTGGNQSACEATIEVVDLIVPVSTCPEDSNVMIKQGEVYTLPDYFLEGAVNAIDNCTTTFTNYLQTPVQGTEFTQGSYSIEIQIFDAAGNMGLCSFSLTVEEIDEAPNAICQNMQVMLDDSGNVLLDATLIGANSTDDNGIASYEVSPNSFDCSHIGFQSVILAVTDTVGNQSSCESIIEVVDTIVPFTECPEDSPVIINQGDVYTLPDYFIEGAFSVTDNCTTTFTNYLQSPLQGTELTQGSFTIEIQVFDESDNMGTCSFVLTVEEVLGTNENALINDNLKIYPNPVSSILTIETTSNLIIENTAIISISGKKLFETTSNAIDFSSLQNGLYFVQIVTSKGTITKKVFKK